MMMEHWRRLVLCAVAVCLLLVCFGCAGGSDDGKLHEGFYRDMTMTANGTFLPQGKLSEKEAMNAGVVYKVEMDKEHKDQPSKITAMYKGKTVRTTVWKTAEGLWEGTFASVTITPQDNGYVQYAFLDAGGEKCAGFFNAYSIRFKTDEKTKNVTAAYLYNKDGENQLGKDKKISVSQLLFTYDQSQRLSKISTANQDGASVKATALYGGNATALQIDYDKEKKDRISAISWVNEGGNLVKGLNWAKETFSYDEKGRLIEKAHFGADDNPIDVKNSSRLTAIYSLNRPAHLLNGLMEARECAITGGAVTRYTYDKDATSPSSVTFIGKSGQNYAMAGNEIAEIDFEYDAAGNVTKFSTRGADGNLKTFSGNIDTVSLAYDDSGNIAKETYYHGDNETALKGQKFESGSVAEIAYTYDDRGRVTSEEYFDASGAPTDLKVFGSLKYHKTTYTYKDDGSVEKTQRFSQDGDEVPADGVSAVYGTYRPTSSNIDSGWRMGIQPGKFTLTLDSDRVAGFEQRTHRKYKPVEKNVTIKADIGQQTGSGTFTVTEAGGWQVQFDVNLSAGIITEADGTKWKRATT